MSSEEDKRELQAGRSRLFIYCAVIFALALAVRLFVIFAFPPGPHLHDAAEYNQLASSILDGKGFSRPDGTPTACRPPFYPVAVALIYWLFGPGDMAVFIIQGILLAVTCVLIYLMGRAIYGNRVGLIAAIGGAFYPMLIYPALEVLTEALFIFLFTLTLFAVFKSRETGRWSVMAGLFLAMAALTKPLALFAFPFFLFWIGRSGNENRWKFLSLFTLTFILCLVPWTLRNFAIFGGFVPVTTGGGIAFYNSYVLPPQGLGFNSLDQLPPEFFTLNDEMAQSRYLFRQALDYMVGNPLKVVFLTFFKLFLFFYPLDGYWYPISLGSKYNLFWGLVFCFSLAGPFSAGDREGKGLLLLTLLSILFGAVIFAGIPRFRLALEPVFVLLAAGGFLWMQDRWRSLSYALILLNVLLWLVFRIFDLSIVKWSTWSNFF